MAGTIKLVPHCLALVAIQLDRGTHQSPAGAVSDGDHPLQIAQQFGDGGRRRSELALPLCFEKQLRLFENPLPNGSGGASPSRIQLPGFTAGEAVGCQRFGQTLAVLRAGTGHRHQELHGHVGGDLALAHLLLDGLRQEID
ncbi:MAG TPA: hypothetical protein VKM93_04440 [Terriglobia bacterium]|nr:hypothetical protein [Terriglobia bacterium]